MRPRRMRTRRRRMRMQTLLDAHAMGADAHAGAADAHLTRAEAVAKGRDEEPTVGGMWQATVLDTEPPALNADATSAHAEATGRGPSPEAAAPPTIE